MLQPIGDQSQRQRLHGRRRLLPGTSVRRHARQRRDVSQPTAILFAKVLDCQREAGWGLRHESIMPPICGLRDRDRLRQEILENLGWKIHRVWSTDWFKNRDGEIKRMLRYIEGLLENDPAYKLERQKVSRAEALRRRLVTLRDTEITPTFPGAPIEKSLLRDDLIEAFLEKRPKNRDEWFRRIPQHMRSGVDSKQVGKYLDRVLGIIGEHE